LRCLGAGGVWSVGYSRDGFVLWKNNKKKEKWSDGREKEKELKKIENLTEREVFLSKERHLPWERWEVLF